MQSTPKSIEIPPLRQFFWLLIESTCYYFNLLIYRTSTIFFQSLVSLFFEPSLISLPRFACFSYVFSEAMQNLKWKKRLVYFLFRFGWIIFVVDAVVLESLGLLHYHVIAYVV